MNSFILDFNMLMPEPRLKVTDSTIIDEFSIEDSNDTPIINIVNEILVQGINLGASDIHIEPIDKLIKIRFRIDGVLKEIYKLPIKILPPLTSRIKIMAEMDIAEKRLPQDGRTQLSLNNKKIDLRVSSLPTILGEKLVLRVLDQEQRITSLDGLGLAQNQYQRFCHLLRFPHGMILVTGPTGSGKTTTLYAALNRLSAETQNMVTIEDPVEYVLSGVNQVQINPKAGLDFAKGLRAVLRQDPDVIMVGEIRDPETAEIAVRASTTGHLVLSTLHTNDAVGALTRLAEMGVDGFFVASAVIGVIAQRLIRKVCPQCKIGYTPEEAQRQLLLSNHKEGLAKDTVLYAKGPGCSYCNFTGYKGRLMILEILEVNSELGQALLRQKDTLELKKIAHQNGMISLKRDGFDKVLQGLTTIDEVIRVTYDGEYNGY